MESHAEVQERALERPLTHHVRHTIQLSSFAFECGAVLEDVTIAYETWGRLNAARDNVVVVCHALTGDAHAGPGSPDGWWADLIGPGCAIDTNRFFVIASNVLGGCAGSTGPSSLAPDGTPYALRFPLVTVRDIVNAQIRLLDELGVGQVQMVIGGSLGGMQVWEWPLLAPGRVRCAVPIAAHAAFTPMGIGYNEAMRQAIVCDPNWHQGNYYGRGDGPRAGLAAARSIGMLTYRTNDLYRARFGREPAERANSRTDDALSVFTEPQFAVESYLHYQGKKLNDRFDANSYLYLTRAMDTHDIGRGRGGLAAALRAFGETRLCVIAIDSDYLYAASDLRETAELAVRCGVDCTYREMSSIYGHDAFLLEQRQLGALLAELEGGVSIEPHRFPRAAD